MGLVILIIHLYILPQNIGYWDIKFTFENFISPLEIMSLLIVCENIITSALKKQENRDAHCRPDFPTIVLENEM
jgi:aspartate oxidase